ncbi:MAG: hypothetical protein A3B68_04080 [Candidatus Melainabacteria bacterium RIFCSPHIGHO2_02_FULL_34_12]|nr:MAG: hypothetical protein A3B68_04080 [Candidatus Melainabacteria bacterium RIFCSPHIGHO2_02_FULL_34_12]
MIWVKDIISILYPELLVLLALILAIFLCTTKFKDIIWVISVMFMFTGILHIIRYQLNFNSPVQILNGAFIADSLSTYFRLITLVTAIFIVLASVKYTEGFFHKSEFNIILLSSVLGMMILVGANDLITLFVGLETLGLSSIMLAGYSKYDLRSNEASLKYLLNSASASAIFLFGLSIIYGLTGSTQFYEIKYKLLQLINTETLNYPIIAVTLILIISGLGFKLASVPFHMWSPDVYEGAPTPVTAFLATASKAAGVAITLRILFVLFDFAQNIWQPLILLLALLSMVVGNLIALGEIINKSSIKRLMAYSSIAQVGYILMGLALAKPDTISASLFYLTIYLVMNICAFLCIIEFGNEANTDSISDYSGLIKKRPWLTFAFAISLFNLAGLPIPPAGFIAKFILFKSAFEAGLPGIIMGSIALTTTIISVFYYLYIAKLMIVNEPSVAVLNIDSNKDATGKSRELNAAITLVTATLIFISIISNPILQITNKTTESITNRNQYLSLKK